MKNSFKKLFATVSTLAIIGTAFVGVHSASAATSDTVIKGGSLTVTDNPTISNFADVTLNGKIQTTNANIDNLIVTDATGTGNGWNVNIEASPFTNSETNSTLPEGSLTIAAPTLTAEDGSSDPNNINIVDGAIDKQAGIDVLAAPNNEGMGTYTATFPENALTLNLKPKDVKEGTYTSTITITVVSAP
ncbi:hypothetical protein JOD43_003965 [Pullulanibacillus pueri]|uniref:WxL domain-containing protein n=1 Tax=Pullulanibacillus pueri TaxID=1437324 RepID=A0A8J2ZYU6_9BACL|nr:WxL domain-containing protein [Pullulanibacillus pueri]MBM7683784.1 hypothetical protein [Pullulanibacillus pueri]GGH87257.1 hypothetical protein GCM10007096_36860 [Pullulanibacillus pueri]